MFAFEEAFGVPAGHTLREVTSAPLARPGMAGGWRWEHEEYDARGALVAVYESWSCGGGEAAPPGSRHRGGFVKYSPHGWVLRRSAVPPRVTDVRAGEGARRPRMLNSATPVASRGLGGEQKSDGDWKLLAHQAYLCPAPS